MTVEFDEYAGLPGTLPSTGPRGDYTVSPAAGNTAAGETHLFTLANSVGTRFVTGSDNGLGIGFATFTNFQYNLGYYGYFDPGQIRFQITGTTSGAGSFFSGAGGDGKLTVTYTSSSVLESALSPVAGTDGAGDAYAAGYTGDVSVFQPGSSPLVVEGWHNLSMANGWALQGFARYKQVGYKLMLVEVQMNDNSATSGTFAVMPSGYAASQSQFPALTEFANSAGVSGSAWIVQIGTGAGASLTILNWAKKSHQFVGNFFISLD
jgi:hypothetical protein